MSDFLQSLLRSSSQLFQKIDTLSRHRLMSILVVFFLSFGGSWLWAAHRGIPVPYIHDEFSYLLAADTFAHGRVTNTPHPLWIFFETFYVLQRPTYMSIYPPAQGFFLAIGKVIGGHPIYGVWLSSALMCAAICWMLYAWVSPRWALVGGLVAVLQFGIFTYWSQSYWGGAVAGIGGALVFGALPRIFKTQRIRDALWLGLGCAILANSRPLEGFLVAIPVGCLLLPWKIRWKEIVPDKFIKKIILPLSIILLGTVLGIGEYNKQITDHSKDSPYTLYDKNYSSVPRTIFQPLHPAAHFNHLNMHNYEQGWSLKRYMSKRTWGGFLEETKTGIFRVGDYYFGFILAIPSLLVFLLFFRCKRRAWRFILAVCILLCPFVILSEAVNPHYFSPLIGLVVLFITIGLRGFAWLKLRKIQVGFVIVLFLIAIQLALNIILTPHVSNQRSLARCIQNPSIILPDSFTREELKNVLLKRGGKYLVIVQYSRGHNWHYEWVHNDADIDNAPIVWAWDMDGKQNKRLLEYFKNRQVLYINVCRDEYFYVPYFARQL